MIVVLKHIEETGFITTAAYDVIHNISDKIQENILYKDVLAKYADSLILIRGLSDFEMLETTASTLKTAQYEIDIKSNNMNFLMLPEPAYGSAIECISRNASLTAQIKSQEVQRYFDGISVKLNPVSLRPDVILLPLTEIRSNGFITHLYEMKVTFMDDWSPTCATCQNGMLYLRNELSKLSQHLYVAETHSYSITGKVISDLNVSNKDVLKDQIGILLKNALADSRVLDFKIIDTNGETGDET